MDVREVIGTHVRNAVRRPLADGDDIFALALVDSLFAIQLVAFVEERFAIPVERQDLDINNFCSINAMAGFVTRKRAELAGGASPALP